MEAASFMHMFLDHYLKQKGQSNPSHQDKHGEVPTPTVQAQACHSTGLIIPDLAELAWGKGSQ